ncbi:hypothetical protein FACS1894170_13100 [Planctomycetales bacterium]|nr:hypothetical protein FACS1894170_13100 [Planctomycetales bacterium]
MKLVQYDIMIFASIFIVILFSLCYAASRHEDLREIIKHAISFGSKLALSMIIVVVVLELVYQYLY